MTFKLFCLALRNIVELWPIITSNLIFVVNYIIKWTYTWQFRIELFAYFMGDLMSWLMAAKLNALCKCFYFAFFLLIQRWSSGTKESKTNYISLNLSLKYHQHNKKKLMTAQLNKYISQIHKEYITN